MNNGDESRLCSRFLLASEKSINQLAAPVAESWPAVQLVQLDSWTASAAAAAVACHRPKRRPSVSVALSTRGLHKLVRYYCGAPADRADLIPRHS